MCDSVDYYGPKLVPDKPFDPSDKFWKDINKAMEKAFQKTNKAQAKNV